MFVYRHQKKIIKAIENNLIIYKVTKILKNKRFKSQPLSLPQELRSAMVGGKKRQLFTRHLMLTKSVFLRYHFKIYSPIPKIRTRKPTHIHLIRHEPTTYLTNDHIL